MTGTAGARRACGWMAALALLASGGCARSDLRPDYPRPPSTALPASHDSPLTGHVARLTAQHQGQSGMRLVGDAGEALLDRVVLADRAVHALDVQYYIFESDATGKLLAQRMLAAADRGVRVRLLLDDLHVTGNDAAIAALDGHPNIQIRLFNPFLKRDASMLSMGGQFAGDFSRLNRRMHNKAFIADGTIAVVGGRNIGDDYFDAAHGVNFRDLDLLTIGPVVTQTERVFDQYWNSAQSYPIRAFHAKPPAPAELAAMRKALADSARRFRQTDYAQSLVALAGDQRQEQGEETWAWGIAQFLADAPAKGDPGHDGGSSLRMAPEIKAWVDGVQHRLTLISPYFIPGAKGVAYLQNLRKRGVAVDVLTNSLASTDAGGVYQAYASYRPPLLRAGVSLYELKPAAGTAGGHAGRLGASAGVSLHAKAMVIDDRRVFVGSMNLDPRSRDLNTEDGVIADSPALALAVLHMFAGATSPASAYRVRLAPDGSDVYWESEDDDGHAMRFNHAPQTSAWRRFKTRFVAMVPIEGLL